MNTTPTIPIRRRELGCRVSGDTEIALYWNSEDDTTSIEIWHGTTDETITFTVARERALDAFRHPFAYLLESREAA